MIENHVRTLRPIPMAQEGNYCENPYWHDTFRSGQELNEGGRFHLMHGNLPKLEGEPHLCQLRNSNIVIVDQKTGRRLCVDLTIFEDEEFWNN